MDKRHPQEFAHTIGANACLMMCYLYCLGIDPDPITYYKVCFDALAAGVDKSGIGKDCTVENAELFLLWVSGHRFNVTKKVCSDIRNIKQPTPVKYTAAGYIPHWVVVENGEIVFNSLLKSYSVDLGRPTDARIITLAK